MSDVIDMMGPVHKATVDDMMGPVKGTHVPDMMGDVDDSSDDR